MTARNALSPLQRDVALRRANEIRCANAVTYREISELTTAEGRRAVAAILRDPTGTQPAMRVGALLRSIRYVEVLKAAKFMHRAGLQDAHRRIAASPHGANDALTERQRKALAYVLDGAAAR